MSTPTQPKIPPGQIHQLLEQWQREGLLDAATAVRIEAAEAAHTSSAAPVQRAAPPPRVTGRLLTEALAYAGAALVMVAIGLLAGREWHRFGFATQVALLGAAALLMLVAGALVPDGGRGAARRLRSVLWTVSTGLALSTWVVAGGEGGLGWSAEQRLLVAGALAAVQAALLWRRCPAGLLHLATFASLAITVGAASTYATVLHGEAIGVGLVLFAVAWALLATIDVVRPRLVAYLAACLLAVSGALSTAGPRWGAVFVVAVALGVVAFAVWQHSLPILAVGTYGMLAGIPAAADRLFHGSLAIAIGLLLAGLLLIGSAIWTTRRSARAKHSATGRGLSPAP